LRTVEANFADKKCPIYVLCDSIPPWYVPGGRVRFIRMDGYDVDQATGMLQARHVGLQLAEMVLWMADDIYMLDPCGWEEFELAVPNKDITRGVQHLLGEDNGHRLGMGRAAKDLIFFGVRKVLSYSYHLPYLYHRDKSLEVLRRFNVSFSGAYETLYYNWHQIPGRSKSGLKTTHLPAKGRFLNHPKGGPTERTKKELLTMFPEVPAWEASAGSNLSGFTSERLAGELDCKSSLRSVVNQVPPGGKIVMVGLRNGKPLAYLAEYAAHIGKSLVITGYDRFQDGRAKEIRDALGKCLSGTAPQVQEASAREAAAMHGSKTVDAVWLDIPPDQVVDTIPAWRSKVKNRGFIGGQDPDFKGLEEKMKEKGFNVVTPAPKVWRLNDEGRLRVRIHSNTRMVIAGRGEDVGWSEGLRGAVTVYVEDEGREAGVYLRHIVGNWDTLEDYTIFLQADPFPHCRNLGDKLTQMEWLGKGWYPLGEDTAYPFEALNNHDIAAGKMAARLGIEGTGESWRWSPGACFVMSESHIKSRPRQWWADLLDDVLHDPLGSWAIERLWGALIPTKDPV
jgi:hypothetical protein